MPWWSAPAPPAARRRSTRFLIGADGANSTVRRLCGLPAQELGFAIEGQVATDIAGDPSVRIDFGVVPYSQSGPFGPQIDLAPETRYSAEAP